MNCYHCGHHDALALFSSLLCVNDGCQNYDAAYAKEKGYDKPKQIVGITDKQPDVAYLGATYLNTFTGWDGSIGWSGIYWITDNDLAWDDTTYTTTASDYTVINWDFENAPLNIGDHFIV